MASENAKRFMNALQELEQTGNLDPLVEQSLKMQSCAGLPVRSLHAARKERVNSGKNIWLPLDRSALNLNI
jgi:hypothetical protein